MNATNPGQVSEIGWEQLRTGTPWLDVRQGVHHRSFPAHRHDFHELVLVAGGRGRHHTIDGVEKLRAGDLLWIPVSVWHAYEDCRALDIRMWLLHPEWIERELPILRALPPWAELFGGGAAVGPRARRLRVAGREKAALSDGWERMRAAAPRWREPATHLELMAEWLKIAALVARALGVTEEDAQARGTRGGARHPAVTLALRVLQGRFTETWSLAALAKECGGLHPSHLMRVFKAETGETILAHLERRRLRHAANLLCLDELTVTEVATRSGFQDGNYFGRRFRAAFGTSPLEYRKRVTREARGRI